MGKWLVRLIEAAAITITIAAVCQELAKPKEARQWHGKVGLVPYDFRLPTMERFQESFWNPDDGRIFTSPLFGIGWAINFCTLLDKMRVIEEAYATEADFLMPTESIKKVLEHWPVIA